MGSGDGEYRAKAAELGIERMIIFTGAIDYTKAAIYLAAGDIAVSAKLFQTESNSKLLNYMACGLPTVVFDTPVNRELLGDAGVYAEYGDCSDLAAKLTWLAGNAEERQRLRALGLAQVEQRHTWDNRGRALDEVYRVKLKR
jgi:glycosyltransferase involved in cell wall biosynthesis